MMVVFTQGGDRGVQHIGEALRHWNGLYMDSFIPQGLIQRLRCARPRNGQALVEGVIWKCRGVYE